MIFFSGVWLVKICQANMCISRRFRTIPQLSTVAVLIQKQRRQVLSHPTLWWFSEPLQLRTSHGLRKCLDPSAISSTI